jgi:hypothetical protein
MIDRNQVGRGIKLKRVIIEIGDKPTELTRPETAPVTPQVKGVKVITEVGQVVRDVSLKEVVVPAVDVERCARPNPRTRLADQRCDKFDVGGFARRLFGIGQHKVGRLVAAQEVRTPGGHPPIVPGRPT